MTEQQTVNPVRIFISGACAGLTQVRDSLAAHAEIEFLGSASEAPRAAQKIRSNGTQVILHAVSMADELPFDDIEALREQSHAPIVLLVNEMAPELLNEALQHGISDVVLLPQLTENLVFSIKKAHSLGQSMQSTRKSDVDSRVITVFSPKGGSGKSTIVTNMAAMYAQTLGKKTLLIDVDLQFGDVAIMLGTEPQQTLLDLVMSHGELDPDKVLGFVTHHESGLHVLPAPLRPEDAELISDERLGNLIDVAKRAYDIVLIDTPTIFNSSVLTVLDRTDALLVVASMEIPALKSTRVCLQTLDMLNFPRERAHVLMNRAGTKVGLKEAEVEKVLERPVRFEVPSSRNVVTAINRGVPISVSEPKSDVAKSIRKVCVELSPEGAEEHKKAKRKAKFSLRRREKKAIENQAQLDLEHEIAAQAAAPAPAPEPAPDAGEGEAA